MGFLLFDGIDDNVSIPEITIDGNYKITLIYKDATTVGEGYLLDSGASGASRLVANITAAGVVESKGYFTQSVYIDDVIAVDNKPSTVAGEINRVELTRTLGEADQTTLKVGTIFNRYAGSYNFGATLISLQIDIRDDSDNVTSTYFYDANASSGTGLTLPETSLNNDGTLNNFPTDDSQWVEFAGAPTPSITSVVSTSGFLLRSSTFTIVMDGTTDLTAASTITVSYGGIALSNVTATNSTTITADGISAGLELDAAHDLIITVDGNASDTYSQTLLPPTGYSATTLTSIDSESVYADADYTGNAGGAGNNISVGDQVVYKNTTNEDGTAVELATDGTYSLPNAIADNVSASQTINWFYLDAQDSYGAGATASLTLVLPSTDIVLPDFPITVEPPTGKDAVTVATISGSSPLNGVLDTGDIVILDLVTIPGGYVATMDNRGIITLSETGNDETTQTINWYWLDSSDDYSSQTGGTYTIELDTTAPVITLIGATPISIDVGGTYTEQGATALDSNEGDLTSEISTTGSVDVNQVDSYTITYTVSDALGNTSSVDRIVNVIAVADNTKPVITLVGNATVSVELNEAYTDQGATATDNIDGDITNRIAVTSNVNVAQAGVYTVSYDVSDTAGNAAETVRRTVVVTVDGAINDLVNDLIPRYLSTDVQQVTLFKSRGNRFRIQLSHQGSPLDLSLFNSFLLYGLTDDPINSNDIANVIDWNDGEGVININAGLLATVEGKVKTSLVGYSAEYPTGAILWHPNLKNSRVTVNVLG